MNVADVPKTLIRRWYLTLVGLVLTAGMCLAALALVHPNQRVESSLLLLPPTSAVGRGGNPYLGLGGLSQASDVLARTLNAQSTRQRIEKTWPKAEYTVEPDFASDGPILVVTVEDTRPAVSFAVTDELLSSAAASLDNLQSGLGVRDVARIRSAVLTKDVEPQVVRSHQLRALVAVGGAGLAGTALIVALLDGVLLARRERRPVPTPDPEVDGDGFGWGWSSADQEETWLAADKSRPAVEPREKVDSP